MSGAESAGLRAFEDGIVRSEILRVRAFLGFLAVTVVFFVLVRAAPWIFSALFDERVAHRLSLHGPYVIAGVAVMLAYELIVLTLLGRHLREKSVPARFHRMLNGAIEVSWVTGLLIVSIDFYGGVETANSGLAYLYMPVLVLSALNLDARLCVWMGFVACAGYSATVFAVLTADASLAGAAALATTNQYGFKALMIFMSGLAAGVVAGRLRRQLEETVAASGERDRAVSIFGQHVSPEVADVLLQQRVSASGDVRDVCVMFLDIRGFTAFSENRSAAEVLSFLNTLFGGLISCVNAHHGIVNKFLGDGFMAIFGAPADDDERCRHAVECAKELLREVGRLVSIGAIPAVRIGIGLHYGRAMTGNVGSRERKEYTVIGNTVNVASRIEQATKVYECSCLASESVVTRLPESDRAGMTTVGDVRLRGQSKPLRLYRVA